MPELYDHETGYWLWFSTQPTAEMIDEERERVREQVAEEQRNLTLDRLLRVVTNRHLGNNQEPPAYATNPFRPLTAARVEVPGLTPGPYQARVCALCQSIEDVVLVQSINAMICRADLENPNLFQRHTAQGRFTGCRRYYPRYLYDCPLCYSRESTRDSREFYDPYDDEEAPRGVLSYSYKPEPRFHGEGPLFLGPEIEVEIDGRRSFEPAMDLANDYLDSLGYLKDDGSLSNGFEIVTHPMSYDWAMNHFPWPMLPELVRAGARARQNCGLHVHVSKAGFSNPMHVYRWMKFFYRHRDPIRTVARRQSEQWASFSPHERAQVKNRIKGQPGERYVAINTQNRHTFELRVFASSLDPIKVQAAFGLADSTVEYTRDLSTQDILKRDGWGWDPYLKWIKARGKYEPLVSMLERS